MAISCPEADEIPAKHGTYALLLFCPRPKKLRIGRLGVHPVAQGWYVYLGSAFASGGLRARCRHHLRQLRRPRWHIDYLRPAASLQEIWFTSDSVPREHQWAEIIRGLSRAGMPIPGFGSSDCICPAHLMYFPYRPLLSNFQRSLHRLITAHDPIMSIGAIEGRPPRQSSENAL